MNRRKRRNGEIDKTKKWGCEVGGCSVESSEGNEDKLQGKELYETVPFVG